jgi:zinc transport system ATP-binding protein
MTIEVSHLSFSRQKSAILEDVTLSVKSGEFIGIFGPNGGGKTTFLKLLLGLLKPAKGSVKLFGKPPETMRARVGYVPQLKQFDPQFPICALDVVLMGLLSKKKEAQDKEKALAILERFQLTDKAQAPFGTLSGGQAQRVLIARALVGNPEILLLDEPTVSIDKEAEELIYEILSELRTAITILMVTHDLQPLLEKADRLVCIQKTLSIYKPQEVCGHFSMGLYHP